MNRDRLSRLGLLVSVGLFGLFWLIKPTLSQDPTAQAMWNTLISRILGSAVFLFALIYLEYRVLHRPARGWWLAFFPALLIAVNNAPILALAAKAAWVERFDLLGLYIADTLLIGVFEELAFRGVLFPALLEKHRDTKKGVLWTTVISSALFGLVHLANLFEGGGFGATVLQVGYSFLIGGMCAIVLLKSGNLLLCMLLHFVYDLGGRLIDTIGAGRLWDTPTVVITAVLGVAVTAWLLYLFFHLGPQDADRLFPKRASKKEKVGERELAGKGEQLPMEEATAEVPESDSEETSGENLR